MSTKGLPSAEAAVGPGSNRAGYFVTQGEGSSAYQAFIPARLPPDPPLEISPSMRELLERANLALGRLDGAAQLLPNPETFLYMHMRQEAVLSSQIEGTQSSLSDLLLYESGAAPGVPLEDVEEVSSYVRALNHGLELLHTELPLSLRLIREVHRVLITGGRGTNQAPGEFRRSQNWIGGSRPGNARFVPPPPHEVMPALDNLEKFLHDRPTRTTPLLKSGLVHAQFETIHPFLDGNGRVGRLLIPLVLAAERVLSTPLLYVSLHFKRHRSEYYERLQRVRTHGDWEGWMDFYLDGIGTVAAQAAETIGSLQRLFAKDRKRVLEPGAFALSKQAARASNLRVYEYLCHRAVLTIPNAARALGMSKPTVNRALRDLEALGIVREVTGKQRDRVFVYGRYLALLDEGTSDGSP